VGRARVIMSRSLVCDPDEVRPHKPRTVDVGETEALIAEVPVTPEFC
jgi:hypothetical protein